MTPRTVVIESPGRRTMQQLHAHPRRACAQLRTLAEIVPAPAVWFVHEGTTTDDLGPVDREDV